MKLCPFRETIYTIFALSQDLLLFLTASLNLVTLQIDRVPEILNKNSESEEFYYFLTRGITTTNTYELTGR